jgi:hypothetical protein
MTHTPALTVILLASLLLSGCATTRQLSVGAPTHSTVPIAALPGAATVDGDEYYLQLVSEPVFKEGDSRRGDCREFGSSYAKGSAKTALMFQVHQEALNYAREVPGLVFETQSGHCGFNLEAKRAYLTPWMRLEAGKALQVDYSFLRSDSGGLDVGRIGSEVNAASNVLAFSGVGTGVALVGKVASGWMLNQSQSAPAPTADSGRHHQESRTLPPVVTLTGSGGALAQIHFPVYQVAEGRLNPLPADPETLGELKVYVDLKPSLLLRAAANGLPDARDLSLDELLHAPMQGGSGSIELERLIQQAEEGARPNLQPDWASYREVEQQCRKLKVLLKDLGFNVFDRNALLYYFLDKSPDWKNYNTTGQRALAESLRASQLQQYRGRNFGGCLAGADYEAMKRQGLSVNGEQDWANTLQQVQEKEAYFGAIQSVERQLAAALRNTNVGEMERQLYPLIATAQVRGSVLLQNHLGNFGLEQSLGVAALPGEGAAVTAQQLAQAFVALKPTDFSCARPAFEQGRPVNNVAIMLFATAPESPLAKGGALEFQFDGGKVGRLSLQSPMLRDFRQSVLDHPEFGDCRIDAGWLQRL